MKITKIDEINYSVEAHIEPAKIEENIQKLAKEAAKTVKVQGFRKGHVPVNMVLNMYKEQLSKDAEQDALNEVFKNAIDESKMDAKNLIGEPMFKKFERENGIKCEFVISFRPEIKLDGYEKLIPELKVEAISDDKFKERKEFMLKQFAPLEKSDKTALENGDFAKFDFEGFLDGEAFDGGKAENYVLEIGSKQFIPGFEDGMLGLKVGEEKDINVTFPENYQAAHLAGKAVVFKVKLHEIQSKKMPEITEDLLKQMLPGEENVSEEILDKKIKEQLENEAKFKEIDEKLKPEFVEKLLENFDFAVPMNILEQETNLQLNQAARSFSKEEIEKFKDEKYLEEKRQEYMPDAKKSVKLTFIVDELAKLRNVSASDQEVMQAVYFEALRYGMDPKELMQNYQKNGTLAAVRMSLIEEKLFADIFLGKDK